MKVILCQDGAARHGPTLRVQLAEKGVKVGFVECFDKCETCERRVLAKLDGASVAAKSTEELLEMVSALLKERALDKRS
jgi:uncharacterized protein YuzB (UPF0349 family)